MEDNPKPRFAEEKNKILYQNDEIMHMHSEITKTIEFIKNNMLQYLYYSLGLQAALFGYFQTAVSKEDGLALFKSVPWIFVAVSLLIALICTIFTRQYYYNYKFLQYRLECYIEPKLSPSARMVFDIPNFLNFDFCADKDSINKDYKDFIKWTKDPFQKMFFITNWGVSLFVIYSIYPVIIRSFTQFLSDNVFVLNLAVFIVFIGVIYFLFLYNTKKTNPSIKILIWLRPLENSALKTAKIHIEYACLLDEFTDKCFSEHDLRKRISELKKKCDSDS